ncbi:MAG: flagellar protein FliT [Methylophaga sp.]|nr:flagellar protein FliT [Methylophaga sp.]
MLLTFDLILNVTEKSKQLLSLAKEEKWDEFSILDTERQTILLDFDFKNINLSEQDSDNIYHQMSELVNLNEKLESICVAKRNDVVGELKNIRQGAKVTQAYSQ